MFFIRRSFKLLFTGSVSSVVSFKELNEFVIALESKSLQLVVDSFFRFGVPLITFIMYTIKSQKRSSRVRKLQIVLTRLDCASS